METILIAITIVSVAIAVASLTALWRWQRAERLRSDARVAALSSAAVSSEPTGGGWQQVAGEWQWVPGSSTSEETRVESPAEGAPAIAFGTVERGEATTGRLPLFAAAVLIFVLGSAMLFLRTSAQESSMPGAQAARTVSSLELLSLGHQREARSLTITGTVRNPVSGHKLEGLTAVVSLLDKNGGLVSTKDVPLDYRALEPGDEAPFKLNVPDPGAIARYRVSFRAGTEVVPHVDRRSETKLASALR